MSLDINKIREDFEILKQTMNSKQLIYLDSAATALKPKQTLEAMNKYNEETSANVHRGVYKLSHDATDLYEGAREKVRQFIGAKDVREIVFTKRSK